MPWLVLAFCAGAGCVHFLPTLPGPGSLLAVVSAALLSLRRLPALAALLLGFAWTAAGAHRTIADDWPCARDREIVELDGVVTGPATLRQGRVDFDLRATPANGTWVPARLRLSWYEAAAIPLPGQVWRLRARIRCRNGLANPGAPDRELELLRQRINATGYVAAGSRPLLLEDRYWRYPVERLRARIAARIGAAVQSGDSAAVLQGLAVGARSNVPERLWEAFAATGVAHLMAISGLHVTGFALFVLFMLRAGWRVLARPRRARIGVEMTVVVVATGAYALLAGASLPTLRTVVMVAIVAAQRFLRRSIPVHTTLASAALLLVAADPLAVSSPGFWLSFVATAALIALIDAGPGWVERGMSFVRAQATILWLLAPVLAIAFGRLSLIAPIANALAIPVFSCLLLPVILLATALTAIWPASADGIWHSLGAVLDACWP
ncbi:MAG: ComEC/Rec2 family competence protein, partial [Steroidobacteraceae bacterium]